MCACGYVAVKCCLKEHFDAAKDRFLALWVYERRKEKEEKKKEDGDGWNWHLLRGGSFARAEG